MRFRDRVVVVTGGASGMGRATSIAFAREGAVVFVADILEVEGKSVVGAVAGEGGRATYLRLDVTSVADWEAAMASVVAQAGGLDILVNNAGVSGTVLSDELELTMWDRMLAINCTGAFIGTHFAVPLLRKRGGGVIINISSIAALRGQSGIHFGYNAAKAAVATLTKSTAVTYGPEGIRCCSVHPGVMEPMRSTAGRGSLFNRDKIMERVPLGRSGVALDVAMPVLFLASDEASYITGAELHVDGGFLAG